MHTLAGLALALPLLAVPRTEARPEMPVYVAICREVPDYVFPRGTGMRIELLGALEGAAMERVDIGLVAAPSPVVSRIRALEWHYREPDGTTGRVDRFANARLVYGWNEPAEDGEAPAVGEDSSLLVLGACEMPGTMYATRAVGGVAVTAPNARDDRRAREEILRVGAGRVHEVVRAGEAVIGRGTVTPRRESVVSQMRDDYSENMRALVLSRIAPVEVFTMIHPALAEPLTIGEYTGASVKDVSLFALVTIGGEEIAIVIYLHDSLESGGGDVAKVILLRSGAIFQATLSGTGC